MRRRIDPLNAMRVAFDANVVKQDELRLQQHELGESIAKWLCPFKVGDEFTAQAASFAGNLYNVEVKGLRFRVEEVTSRGAGLRKASKITWGVHARRILKGGGLSKMKYYFHSANKLRKIEK